MLESAFIISTGIDKQPQLPLHESRLTHRHDAKQVEHQIQSKTAGVAAMRKVGPESTGLLIGYSPLVTRHDIHYMPRVLARDLQCK